MQENLRAAFMSFARNLAVGARAQSGGLALCSDIRRSTNFESTPYWLWGGRTVQLDCRDCRCIHLELVCISGDQPPNSLKRISLIWFLVRPQAQNSWESQCIPALVPF